MKHVVYLHGRKQVLTTFAHNLLCKFDIDDSMSDVLTDFYAPAPLGKDTQDAVVG